MSKRTALLYLALPIAAAILALVLLGIAAHVSAAPRPPSGPIPLAVRAETEGSSYGPWRTSVATFYSWQEYGVGDYKSWHIPKAGRHPFGCGGWYLRGSIGVAHKTLPCGTLVEFTYRGRTLVVPVVDRGPFTAGMEWDFTSEACLRLRHCFTGNITWRLVP
jgi:hypothetical protein